MDQSPMKITCEQLDDLLLDGEPLAMATAGRHAQTCPECAAKLEGWNDISGTARTMRASWQSDLLLPRIQRSVAAERRRNSPMRFWQVAAAVALTAILGASFWLTFDRQNQLLDASLIRVSTLDEVEQAERAHQQAIDKLAREAASKLEESSAPLMISYKEKLMLLDDAIGECQTAIQQNRQNAHLRKQLLAIYNEKQRTLQDVLREEKHASNQ